MSVAHCYSEKGWPNARARGFNLNNKSRQRSKFMNNNIREKEMALFIAAISLALSVILLG